MSLPTCVVTVRCYTQDGEPDPGARVVARLNRPEIYQGYVIPEEVEAIADAAGVATLTLFRNALGSTSSQYKIRIEGSSGNTMRVTAVVPDVATAYLDDIADVPPYPGQPSVNMAPFVTKTGAEVLSNKELLNPANTTQALVDGDLIAWDMDDGQTATLSLATARTTRVLSNPTNMKSGTLYTLVVTQGAAGGQNFSAYGSAYVLNGATINTDPNAVTVLLFLSIGGQMVAVSLGAPAPAESTAPVNTVPGTQSTAHETPLFFNGANGNVISVADPDGNSITVVLSVNSGTLRVSTSAGANVTGNETGAVTLVGAVDNINAAMYGMRFTPAAGFGGPVTLTIFSDDGQDTDTDTVIINVAAGSGNNPPVNTVPGAQAVPHDTAYTFSTANGNPISVADADDDPLTTTLTVTSGTLTPAGGSGASITGSGSSSVEIQGSVVQVNAALAGLVFTPASGSSGAVTLTVETTDGTDTDTDTVTLNVQGTATTQADTVQLPLVRHPVDWLQVGEYFFNDGVWGSQSSNPSVAPHITEGTASWQYQQLMERSLIVNEDGSVAGRWQLRWPEFNINGDPIYENSYYSEVKTYPSIIFGQKPGYFGSDIWPAFQYVVRAPDGAVVPTPTPAWTPSNIAAEWQPAGGSVVEDAPSGASPGTGTSVMPMQLPLTGKTCRVRGKIDHHAHPTGVGQLAFDFWLTATGPQIGGHLQSSLTHELMIQLSHWGDYGAHGVRNPAWYSHDVTIDGVLYHVYCAKNLGRNPVTGVYDGATYEGLQYNFGSLATTHGYINEETGQPRIGWKFIVLVPDGVDNAWGGKDHPVDGDGYFNIDMVKILAHLATVTDERGVPFIQNTEYLPSIEVGAEIVYGTADYTISNYLCQVANTVVAAPPKPSFPPNSAPVNTVPGAQNVTEDTAYEFSTAAGNLISVADADGDTLTTTVTVLQGTLALVTGGGGVISNNGTASVEVVGTPTQVNHALDGMVYTPTLDYVGSDTLTITTDDGTTSDTDTVSIDVGAGGGAAGPEDIIQAQFTAGNNGWWGDARELDEFYVSSTDTTAPVGWTSHAGVWRNHGNPANGHDIVSTSDANRGQLGTDGANHFLGFFTATPLLNAGGSTTAFYACVAVDIDSYYGTILSDRDAANQGIRIRHNADDSKIFIDAGTGAATLSAGATFPGAAWTPGGKMVIEAWYDGTDIAVRVNKGTAVTTPCAGIAAGGANITVCNDPVVSDEALFNMYHGVVFKDYCPPPADRDAIAEFVGTQCGMVL